MEGLKKVPAKLVMLAVALVIVIACAAAMDVFRVDAERTRTEEIRKAVIDACIQCYALEGSYPPSLEYLEKHYGLMLNRDEYYYYYEVFASNVMPTVEVYKK